MNEESLQERRGSTSLEDADQFYDRGKYVQLVLDVAEAVLGVFGFNRKQLER